MTDCYSFSCLTLSSIREQDYFLIFASLFPGAELAFITHFYLLAGVLKQKVCMHFILISDLNLLI